MRNVVCDLHIGGVNELKNYKSMVDCVLAGDIFDLKNCRKEDNKVLTRVAKEKALSFGKRYIRGNHDYVVNDNDYFIEDGIVYAHGWLEMWDNTKIYEWQNKTFNGTGVFGRTRAKLIDFGRSVQQKPHESFYVKAFLKLRNEKCHTYVCGHKHYKEKIECKQDGLRVVVLPRGFHKGSDI